MAVRSFVCGIALFGVFLASGALAQPGADAARDQGLSPLPFKAANSLLYALPDEVRDGRGHQIEFVVTEGLTVTLRERLEFRVKGSAGPSAVEVLPLHSQLLASLLEDPRPDDVGIAIHLDGSLVEEITLSELSRRNLELAGQGLSMVEVAAPSSALPAALSPAACVRDCEQAWLARQAICERFPRPNCEEQSDGRLTLCLQVCGCPVAIREARVDTTYVGEAVPPQLVCLRDGPRNVDGHYYDRRQRLFKKEHYNEVVYCDGIHRIELGSVDYFTDRCIQRNASYPGPCLPVGESGPELRCQ